MAEDEKDQSKILRFSSDTSSPTHDAGKKYQNTAKYDRKALSKRLSLEEWMHYELQRIYCCKDGEEYNIEIDIDILVNAENDNKRTEMLQKLLHAAREPTNDFIKKLLTRIKDLNSVLASKVVVTTEMSI